MGQKPRTVLPFLALLALAATARAQAAPPPLAPPAPAPTAGPDELPPPPDIKDPMLLPIAEPPNALGSWRDALRFVRQRSTTLRISRAQIEQAAGATQSARAGALPTLGASAGLNRALILGTSPLTGRTVPDPATTFGASLNLTQPILALGAWHAIGTSKQRERVAELSSKDSERILLAVAADAAVTVITATRVAEVSRVGLKSALATLDLTKRRAALGAASAVDVLRSEQEVALSRAVIVSADETLRRAREALGSSLGDTTPWGVSPSVRVDELVQTAGEICRPIDSIETRSDVLAAKENVTAAGRDTSGIDYTYVPTIDAVSGLGYSSTEDITGKHVSWSVGANLNWLLFDGGDRYGQKRVFEARETIAREELTQRKRDVTIEVAQAERAIAVAEANLAVSSETRKLADQSSRLARIAFVNGSGTSFDLVDNARKLREAEIDLLIKNFEVIKARIAAHIARANCSI